MSDDVDLFGDDVAGYDAPLEGITPFAPDRTVTREVPGLDDDARALLDLERLWWQHAGAKESAIRDRFDMSAVRYYQVLNQIIDREEALAYDPLLVKRLRRLRAQRQRTRSARRLEDLPTSQGEM
jgi:hypothetical protein